MINHLRKRIAEKMSYKPAFGALEIFKYLGPGLLVTVGFIDPGNWASNLAAGSLYGYDLLWVVTLATAMLIMLQHNVAHLGIVTGDCLAEAAMKHLNPVLARIVLGSAFLAVISTALAEILGSAIALQMIFGLPLGLGALLSLGTVLFLIYSNTYTKLEKLIIGFVSIIGFSFFYEVFLVEVEWPVVVKSWFTIRLPENSMIIVMALLGAVVMPHNMFLHSEIIQSRQWNLENEVKIKKQLNYEFLDTIVSMVIGWMINSAIIILAAGAFFREKLAVTELGQAQQLLTPLLGSNAAMLFAIALLLSGISATITSGIAGGTIFAGFNKEPYDLADPHTKLGIAIILVSATFILFLITDPFKTLIYSQMLLSIQLPITVFSQIYLTSSKKVMGNYKNSMSTNITLLGIAIILTVLNIKLFLSLL